MSEIKVDIASLNVEILNLKSLQQTMNATNNKCPDVIGGGNAVQQLENIGNSYKIMRNELANLVANTIAFMENIKASYEEKDTKIAKGILQGISSVAGVIGGETDPVVRPINGKIKVEQTTNSNVSITASGSTKYTLPDYALQGLYPDENGVWGEYVYHRDGSLGRVCTWNRPGELSCTYYTLRKLNEQGLSYPCVGGPGNGSDWYANFDTQSLLPSGGGNNALEDLANTTNLPQENIVVSFNSNTSSDLKHCGHVLLIDKMYRDANGTIMVQWSDNYPSIANVNGVNPTKTMSLAEFKNYYYKYNGNINGAVIVGAGN